MKQSALRDKMFLPKTKISFRQNRTGCARAMGPMDGMIYNFLSMGVVFPWVYVYGPAFFPHANLVWAIFFTLLAQIPISIVYAIWSVILPVNGGDYIYQTRAFGCFGAASVMTGFVICILIWVPISGWLFYQLGLVPLALSLQDRFPRLAHRLYSSSNTEIFVITMVLSLLAIALLSKGLRLFALVQRFLFALTLLAVVLIFFVLFNQTAETFKAGMDTFVLHHNGCANFSDSLAGQFPFQPQTKFSWESLWAVPLAWTSLQWATYTVEQNTEIAGADRFTKQLFMMVFSAILVALLLMAIAFAEQRAAGTFMVSAAQANLFGTDTDPKSPVYIAQNVLPPYPSVLAVMVGGHLWIKVLIALGFFASAFQVTCNCFIGMTRILAAMGIDQTLPARLVMDGKSGNPSFYKTHWLYFLASIPISCVYCFGGDEFKDYSTVVVTLECGLVFMITCLAATKIPRGNLSSLWMGSTLYWVPGQWLRRIGLLGFAICLLMLIGYFHIVWLHSQSATSEKWVSVRLVLELLASMALIWLMFLAILVQNRNIGNNLNSVPREASDPSWSRFHNNKVIRGKKYR